MVNSARHLLSVNRIVKQDQVLRTPSNTPARFSLCKYVLSQIHDRYISMMTAFSKEIGYSLDTFCIKRATFGEDQRENVTDF